MAIQKTHSRRNFLKSAAITATGITILPSGIYGKGISPSDKINLAAVGVGGRGSAVLSGMVNGGNVNVVALCDVDSEYAAKVFELHPKAKKFDDFREMYSKMSKDIDAVMVATPDHTHATIALPAMQMGKHVYVEKPLAHNIYETRLLTEAAKKYGVVTQMGDQGSSGEGTRLVQEWVKSGLIGDVHTVHCWTQRPVWPQGIPTPTEVFPVPDSLNWDVWQGPAQFRPFNPAFLHFKWRGWWDYGTGALGDMACHIMQAPFKALDLGYPTSAEASVTQVFSGNFTEADYAESCPMSSKIHLMFPERKQMPEVELIWYDGGIRPKRPIELPDDEALGEIGGGVIMEGSEGKLVGSLYGANPKILGEDGKSKMESAESWLPRVQEGHIQNFVNACIHGTPTSSPFSDAGPLTETVLMGNLAVRSHEIRELIEGKKVGDWEPYTYPGRMRLNWNGDEMKITNFEPANQFVKRDYRKGWEL